MARRIPMVIAGLILFVGIAYFAWLYVGAPDALTVGLNEPAPGYVSRTMFGDAWPLTVEDGMLSCVEGDKVLFETNGTFYAVNGTAKGAKKDNGADRWYDLRQITAPAGNGLIKDARPLVDRGLKLC